MSRRRDVVSIAVLSILPFVLAGACGGRNQDAKPPQPLTAPEKTGDNTTIAEEANAPPRLDERMAAAMNKDDEAAVAELTRSSPCPLNARDSHGWTPLHWAACHGRKDIAELLITKGADVNAKSVEEISVDGFTPLHLAARFGRMDVVELLLAKGADCNAKNCIGWTPLHEAAEYGYRDVVALLLAKGGDFNAKERLGRTPLHFAAICGRKEVVEFLIAKGMDANAKDIDGKTALQWAIYKKHDAVAEVLRKAGAKE